MKRLVVASIAFLSLIPVAAAEMPMSHHAPQDQVILQLTTEGWVKTDTARVSVYVELVQQDESAESLKKRIDASLQSLAKETEWRYTSSSQRLDQTGLNRWYVSAEARIPEDKLAGLQDRAKTASSPGYKVNVAQVDFTPSLAEFEKLRGELRADIYRQAIAEADRLNKVMQGPVYQVRRVDFGSLHSLAADNSPHPRAMMMKASTAESGGGAEASAELLVSVKQSVSAEIVLGRTEQSPQQ
ncbi:SIMPL domain-containing protein [Sneathiella sp.]|uniref:SIMPL domain-containing protein n=1 Tax=Sneathiella sp. TaxID=1964365 RepID=UPI00356AE5DF